MNIYTYYQKVKGQSEEENLWLLDLWKKSWSYYGWNPIVLSLEDSKENPLYEKLCQKCIQYPTINSKEYEMACYVRWLAFSLRGGWVNDYDIINYGFSPMDYGTDALSLTGIMGGSTIAAPKSFYEKVVDTFINYEIDKNENLIIINKRIFTHVSDMTIMNSYLSPTKVIKIETYYGSEGYENSLLVHYNAHHVSIKGMNRKNAIKSDPRALKFLYE
jgi:hypothetical protein